VKKWLLRKKHQVKLARMRGWRGYWVCLKGTMLTFFPCDYREGHHVEAAPKHLIIVDGAIIQPILEHPQRDFIFCLSTAFGDVYLFQVNRLNHHPSIPLFHLISYPSPSCKPSVNRLLFTRVTFSFTSSDYLTEIIKPNITVDYMSEGIRG
jgi:hypothetical protein